MKKHLLIICSILFAGVLTAYGILNDDYSKASQTEMACTAPLVPTAFTRNILPTSVRTDFFYHIGPRFNPVTKWYLAELRSVSDVLHPDEISRMNAVRSTALIILEEEIQTDTRISGKSESFTPEQLEMIQSLEYSTNFLIRVVFDTEDAQAESKGENIYYPHMTVAPEKQAVYQGGMDALLEYLRISNVKNTVNLDREKLEAAKLYFTVSKEGKISNKKLDKTSGYPLIDAHILSLLNDLPHSWTPAEDEYGNKVDQELVISFGLAGC